MSVQFSGNQLHIDADDGRALMFGALIMSPEQERELQAEYLGFDHHTSDRTLTDEEARAILNIPEMIRRLHKEQPEASPTISLTTAYDIAIGGVAHYLKAARLDPVDADGLRY